MIDWRAVKKKMGKEVQIKTETFQKRQYEHRNRALITGRFYDRNHYNQQNRCDLQEKF